MKLTKKHIAGILIIAFSIATINLVSCQNLFSNRVRVDDTAIVERPGIITLEGRQLTLLGPEIEVGHKAPDFKLLKPYERVEESFNSQEVELADSAKKVRLISVVPSLDTPVCDFSAMLFEEQAAAFEGVTFYVVSMDLPFAQNRYCGAQEIKTLITLSDHRDASFGLSYGLLIKELRLLSRAILIIDEEDTVRYVEYVKEISQPPDFDAALTGLREIYGEVSN